MHKHYAQLAQLVEQGTENPCVSGSIPELGIYSLKEYGILAQVVEHLTFNQVVRGSNPRCLILDVIRKNGIFCYIKRIRTTDNVVDRVARCQWHLLSNDRSGAETESPMSHYM